MRTFHFVTPIDSLVYQHLRVDLPIKHLSSELASSDIRLTSGPPEQITEADAVCFANVPGVRAIEYVERLRGLTNLIWQLDDNFWHLPPHNSASDRIKEYELAGLKRCLDYASQIWVTTGHLALEVSRHTGHRDKVRVVPTLVEPTNRTYYSRTAKRCLWAGSATHLEDLELISHLPAAMPDWEFVFFGALPISLTEVVRKPYRNELLSVPSLPNVGYVEPVHYSQYQKVLEELASSSSVGLIPLRDTAFNRCKSPLKYLEFASLGLPVVASDCLPYREVICSGINGELVWALANFGEWTKAIERATADPEIGQLGADNVKYNHSWASEWRVAWTSAIVEAVKTRVKIGWGDK